MSQPMFIWIKYIAYLHDPWWGSYDRLQHASNISLVNNLTCFRETTWTRHVSNSTNRREWDQLRNSRPAYTPMINIEEWVRHKPIFVVLVCQSDSLTFAQDSSVFLLILTSQTDVMSWKTQSFWAKLTIKFRVLNETPACENRPRMIFGCFMTYSPGVALRKQTLAGKFCEDWIN